MTATNEMLELVSFEASISKPEGILYHEITGKLPQCHHVTDLHQI